MWSMASIATINIDATGFHGFPVVSFDGESRIGNLCKVWHFLGTGANEIHLQSIHGFHQGDGWSWCWIKYVILWPRHRSLDRGQIWLLTPLFMAYFAHFKGQLIRHLIFIRTAFCIPSQEHKYLILSQLINTFIKILIRNCPAHSTEHSQWKILYPFQAPLTMG